MFCCVEGGMDRTGSSNSALINRLCLSSFELRFPPDLWTVPPTYSRYLMQETERASNGRYISTRLDDDSKLHRNVAKSVSHYVTSLPRSP